MPIIYKKDSGFPDSDAIVTVRGKKYKADYLIKFPTEDDKINLDNCTCIFSILERSNMVFRQYVGAKFFDNLNNSIVEGGINGYLPENIFCFTETDFPLSSFLEDNEF